MVGTRKDGDKTVVSDVEESPPAKRRSLGLRLARRSVGCPEEMSEKRAETKEYRACEWNARTRAETDKPKRSKRRQVDASRTNDRRSAPTCDTSPGIRNDDITLRGEGSVIIQSKSSSQPECLLSPFLSGEVRGEPSSRKDIDRSKGEEEEKGNSKNETFKTLYRRVRPIKVGQSVVYQALIPSHPFKSSRHLTEKDLVSFGATFKTSIEAGTAADLALVAMWGRFVAAPHLNFPISMLGSAEDVRCRYGSELSSYLFSLTMMSPSRRKRRGALLRRYYDKILPSGNITSAAATTNAVENSYNDNHSDNGHGRDGKQKGIGHQTYLKSKCFDVKVNGGSMKFRWVQDPFSIRVDNGKQLKESAARVLDLHYVNPNSNEEVAMSAAIMESRKLYLGLKGLDVAPNPKSLFIPGPHARIIETARIAADAGVRVGILSKVSQLRHKHDDPLDDFKISCGKSIRACAQNAQNTKPKEFHCSLCNVGHANLRHHRLQCPVVQTAMAMPAEDKAPAPGVCPLCGGLGLELNQSKKCENRSDMGIHMTLARKGKGCDFCRGKVPQSFWRPEAVSSPWLSHICPSTVDFMHAIQQVGSASIHDFDRPEIAGSLGPVALLAMGLLAEEIVNSELNR